MSQGSYSKTGDSLEKGKPRKKNVKKKKIEQTYFTALIGKKKRIGRYEAWKFLFSPTEHYALKYMYTSCFIF